MIFPNLELFLQRYVVKSQKEKARQLTAFRLWLETQGIRHVTDITKLHLEAFCYQVINVNSVRKITKMKHYCLIRAYLKFLCDHDILPKVLTIQSPNFSDTVSDRLVKKMMDPLPGRDDITTLITHAKKVNRRMYIYLVLLCSNGMRDSELRSILLSNIDLDKRVIISGVEAGAAKESTCIYFIPKKFMSDLWDYIMWLRKKYRDPKFLFPGDTTHGFSYRTNFDRNLRKYKELLHLTCRVNAHAFRHALNRERLKMGCNDSLMAILLNQVPTGTNARYYLQSIKNDIEERRGYWDKFTPEYL